MKIGHEVNPRSAAACFFQNTLWLGLALARFVVNGPRALESVVLFASLFDLTVMVASRCKPARRLAKKKLRHQVFKDRANGRNSSYSGQPQVN